MENIARIATLLLVAVAWPDVVIGGNDNRSEPPWRPVPLIADGKVAEDWTHIGWGGFVVDDDSLRTDCDEKGMGLLLYTK